MDNQGRLHVDPEVREQIERFYGKALAPGDVVSPGVFKDADLAIEDESVVFALAGLNRQARLVFRSERRRGASEYEALAAARASLR